MYAMSCFERTGKRAAFDCLLKNGANLNLVDFYGKSIEDYAADRGVVGLF
jgi:ankyrin repeat protein